MALEYIYCLTTYASDCSEALFDDQTVYGTLGNADRHELAKKYLAYKVDVTGIQTLLTMDTEPTLINATGEIDPLLYVPDRIVVPTINDGWYKIVGLTFLIRDNGIAYTAETSEDANDEDVIYYPTTTLIYRCIQNNTGIAPDAVNGDEYWEVVSDFELLVDNTSDTVSSHEWDDVVTCYTERGFLIEATGEGAEALCSSCMDFKEVEKMDFLFLWLNSMYAANNSALYNEAEKVARFIENQNYLQ